MAGHLFFNGLLLTGPGRNYTVEFRPGVNIISGPISTGKSSILELLDYACGSKHAPKYPEISKCSDLYVECSIGAEKVTIRRSLKSPTAKAWLYDVPIASVLAGNTPGREVAPRHIANEASISSEILGRLGLGEIEVKSAPTQDASDTSTFTLRDLFLLIYVDQDRIGSAKSGFCEENPFKGIKWHAAFEIVHGLFDPVTTALSEALKSALAEQARVELYLANAQSFLDGFKIKKLEVLEKQLEVLKKREVDLELRKTEENEAAEVKLGENMQLVSSRAELDSKQNDISTRITESRRALDQLGRLRVQYDRERAQLDFLKESEASIGSLPVVRCPSCFQNLSVVPAGTRCGVCNQELPPKARQVSVDARLSSVRSRISDLDRYLVELETNIASLEKDREDAIGEIRKIDRSLKKLEQSGALPDSRAELEINEALSLTQQEITQIEEHIHLRKNARGEGSNLLAIRERVQRLQSDLEGASKAKPSPAEVIAAFSSQFSTILKSIRFPHLRESSIHPSSFHPVVRGQPYGDLLSKGAVSLTIAAWHLALMAYSFERYSLFPRILMLDSPLSQVGRDATDPDFRDQQIVDAFYQFLLTVNQAHSNKFQLLICDNRPPAAANSMIAVKFTGDPKQGRFGLIDDEHPGSE